MRGDGGNEKKKNTLSAVEDFNSFWWHSGVHTTFYREGETKTDQIDNKTRLYWRTIVKTKHQSLTSLACMRLAPGANRAVRHNYLHLVYETTLRL